MGFSAGKVLILSSYFLLGLPNFVRAPTNRHQSPRVESDLCRGVGAIAKTLGAAVANKVLK